MYFAGHCILLQLACQVEIPAHTWSCKQAGIWKLTGTASKAKFQGSSRMAAAVWGCFKIIMMRKPIVVVAGLSEDSQTH